MRRVIYLLEDDDSIRKLVVYALESQGYQAEGFEAPGLFWQAMERRKPEMVLLDLMLQEQDGIQLCSLLSERALSPAMWDQVYSVERFSMRLRH